MSYLSKFYWVVILLIIGFYVYYINLYAVNVPIGDDYDLIRIKYVLSTQNLSWLRHLDILLAPANDHRILIPRLMALGDYYFEGIINYRTIIGLSNLSILGVILFLGVTFQKSKLTMWYLLPVVLWYLNPFLYDLNLWGMNGVQHTTLNLLVFATLYLLSTFPGLFPTCLAVLLAFAATFTNGNGFLVFPAGLAILLLAKEWKKSIGWSGAMGVALLAYFLDYSVGQATKVTISSTFIQNLFVSFGALSGGWMAAFKGDNQVVLLWMSFVVGGFSVLGLLVWLMRHTLFMVAKTRPSQTYFWVGIFLFSLMTIGIIAVSRGGRDVYSVFTSRYSLYPLHLLTLSYIALLTWKPINQAWIAGLAFVFGVVFVLMSYYQYQLDMDVRRRSLIADHYNWRHHRKLITHFRSELADFFTQPAYDKGIYRFDNFSLTAAEPSINAIADTNQLEKVDLKLSTNTKPIDFFGHPQQVAQFTLENNTVIQPELGQGGVYLVLKSAENRTYILPTWPLRGGKRLFFKTGHGYKPGFLVTFYNENFQPDTYRIGILSQKTNGYMLNYLSQSIEIGSLHAQLK